MQPNPQAKFVCKDQYRQFRGYVFLWNKPTVVKDRATIEACERDPSFERIEDEERKGQAATAPEVLNETPKGTCPHCLRQMERGLFVHVKYCKANPVNK